MRAIAMYVCVCGGVTPLIPQLDKIREISASPPGRFAPGEVIPFSIFVEYDAGCAPEVVWMLSGKYFARARD